jgi:seryl-tRNA synthetase
MLDIKIIKENPELVKRACKIKGFECDIDRILELSEILKLSNIKLDDLRSTKNTLSSQIKSTPSENR